MLQQMNESLAAQLQAMQITMAAQHEEIKSLRSEVNTVKSEQARAKAAEAKATLTPPESNVAQELNIESATGSPAAPSTTTPTPVDRSTNPPTASIAPRSERLPDPPEFTGKKKYLPTFIRALRNKLEGNADRFTSPRAMFLYAQTRVTGDAALVLEPLYDRDVTNVDQLIYFLESSYGDPNR